MTEQKQPSKRGGRKPSPAAFHTCEQCGTPFQASPANRSGHHVFCSPRCAALYRENAAGHSAKITLPCGLCGEPVTRYLSRAISKTTKTAPVHFFCNRDHYLQFRHGKP